MFCSQCGTEVQPDEKFCPKCGTPNEGYSPVDSTKETPAKEPVKTAEVPTSRSPFPVNIFLGVISPIAVFIGIFLPCYTASAVGYTQTMSFLELVGNGQLIALLVVTFIGLLWILLFQLRHHPKISLVGICVLLVDLCLMIYFHLAFTGWGLKLGSGFWLFLLGTIGCLTAGFMKVNK